MTGRKSILTLQFMRTAIHSICLLLISGQCCLHKPNHFGLLADHLILLLNRLAQLAILNLQLLEADVRI